jgi:hypothetical protein
MEPGRRREHQQLGPPRPDLRATAVGPLPAASPGARGPAAVRAPTVTSIASISWTSAPSSRSVRTKIDCGGRRFVWMSSAGHPASIYFVPNNAAADSPAITPDRPDHNHAARARSVGDRLVAARNGHSVVCMLRRCHHLPTIRHRNADLSTGEAAIVRIDTVCSACRV